MTIIISHRIRVLPSSYHYCPPRYPYQVSLLIFTPCRGTDSLKHREEFPSMTSCNMNCQSHALALRSAKWTLPPFKWYKY